MTSWRPGRTPLKVAVLALMMLTAGCTGLSPTDSTTDAGPFTEPNAHPGLTADVDIHNLALPPVHITITELNKNGRGVVLDRTYDD